MRSGAPSRPVDLLLIGVLALAARLAMAWAIPLAAGGADANCAPDEAAHFVFTRALAHGHAPTWPHETSSIYGAFPPAPYAVHAAALALLGARADVGRFTPVAEWARGYGAARIGSALLGVFTALSLAAAASTWTRSRGAGIVVGLATALYPQLVFLGAYTNADAFTVCVGALHVLAVARWAVAGEGAKGAIAVGVTAGLVMVGKMSGYFVLPPTACWVGWALWDRRAARAALGAAATAAVVAGPVLAWNAVRNGGDALGLRHYRRFLAEFWRGADGRSIPDAGSSFLATLPRSTFGVFRNMDLYLPERAYRVAAGILCVGIVAAVARLPRSSGVVRRGALWLAGVVVVNVALVVYNCWFVDFQPQGRYVLLSALLLTAVALLGPAAWLRGRTRWLWPTACLCWLGVTAVEAQVIVFKHPCLAPERRGAAVGAGAAAASPPYVERR